jgi:hypothetical protein
MKTLERILAIGILIALILKFSLVPGGDTLTLWTMMLLACIYYPLGFLFFNHIKLRSMFKSTSYKNVTISKIVFSVVTGLGLSIIVVGSLFKLLNFPGANTMLLSGLIITAIVSVISITLLIKNNDATSEFVLWRAGIVGGIGVFLILTSGLSIVQFQYRNHPDYIKAYTNYLADPQNRQLFKKMELERYRIKLTDEEFKIYQESVNDK